jgi:hypothetical protein
MEVEMIDISDCIVIKCCLEMDVQTKHLTEWIPIREIEDFCDSDLFNGVEIKRQNCDWSYFLHDVTRIQLMKQLEHWLPQDIDRRPPFIF